MKLKKNHSVLCKEFFFFYLGKASQTASLACVPAKPRPAAGTGPERERARVWGWRVTAEMEQKGACSGRAERRRLCRWLSYRAASRKMRIWLIQPTHQIKNQAKWYEKATRTSTATQRSSVLSRMFCLRQRQHTVSWEYESYSACFRIQDFYIGNQVQRGKQINAYRALFC